MGTSLTTTPIITTPFKLYYYFTCPYCKPIYYFIRKNNLSHEAIHINLAKKEQFSPEFVKINPFSKVPAIIEQNGFILFESSTILRYLCNTRNVPDHWYPKDPQKRAQVDLFFDWYQVGSRMIVKFYISKNPLMYRGVILPEEEITRDVEKALTDLENIFLREKKYLAGDEISVADIQMIFFFGQMDVVGYDISKFLKVVEWKNRILATDIKQDYEDFMTDTKKRREEVKKHFELKNSKL